MNMHAGFLPTRRLVLGGLAALTVGRTRVAFAAAPSSRRVVVILLRGAMDGLAAVPPYGDAALVSLRAPLVPPAPGQPGGMFDLGGFYGLHPALPGLASLYRAGELLIVHATAGATRSRSHFEAQDCLECGADHRLDGGWLNRVAGALPPASNASEEAFSVGVGLPLLLRGTAPAESWLPDTGGAPPPDLFARIAALNEADPALGRALHDGIESRGFAAGVLSGSAMPPHPPAGPPDALATLAGQAGHLLAAPEGPRIAALELGGWDTHAQQKGRMVNPLTQLDRTVMALRGGLGEAWGLTSVLVVTEFGRTVHINGTMGTDHGTASVAFVAGGAVAGGRVAGHWPGLGATALFENRDLAPTTDLRDISAGMLAAQFGLSTDQLRKVFPGWTGQPMAGIIRA
jgi:uncharacterized protein (DUF1501 family)